MASCQQCHQLFQVTDADRRFYEKVSPTFGAKKYLIPEPEACPDCRQRRRLVWRNERHLYHRTCGLCKKPIVTIYAPEKPYTVYCRDCWWGDKWRAKDYGRDFDFLRPFFEQFNDLLITTPKAAVMCINIENSEYTSFQNDSRNCYLTFGSGFMEDCQYCDWVYHAKNTFDCSFCDKSELDYENVDSSETYHSKFCQDCHQVSDCEHCFDCRNCKNCFGCVGLRNKEYHLFNKTLSPEQYKQFLSKLRDPKSLPHIQVEIQKLKAQHPHLAARILNSENCTGDDIENCKNCFDSYGIKENQDCRFNYDSFKMKDCQDNNRNGMSELCYETLGGGYYQQVSFFAIGAYTSFSYYCFESMNTKNSFGCASTNHLEYAILNKPYSKDDYEKLVPRVVEHMKETGEWSQFFPPSISPFGYNETLAQEFFPMTEADARAYGAKWQPKDQREYLPPQGDILACSVTGRNFKLTPQEIRFYEQEGLPRPTKHPNQRYAERLARKLPRRLYDRQCAKCQAAIKTPYAPERPKIVVCDACYLKEVY